jgi:hypothetical protein
LSIWVPAPSARRPRAFAPTPKLAGPFREFPHKRSSVCQGRGCGVGLGRGVGVGRPGVPVGVGVVVGVAVGVGDGVTDGVGVGVGVGLAGAAAKPDNCAMPVLNKSVLAPVTGSIE